MRRNAVIGQFLSLFVSLLIIAAGVFGFRLLTQKPEAEASVRTPTPTPLVYTETIRPHSGTLDIAVDGVVVAFRIIQVASEVPGKVVFKDESCDGGRRVTRGTCLIKIDPRDYELAVRRLENQLKQADANIAELNVETRNTDELIKIAQEQLDLEQNEVNRLAGLIQERIVTDSSLDRAKQTLLTARNGLVGLKNQLELFRARQAGLQSARELVFTDLDKAKLDLERTEIVAPVDGTVVIDLVEQDSFVQKGEPLFAISDNSAAEVSCRLKMEELGWVLRQNKEDFKGLNDERSGSLMPQTPVKISYRLSDRQGVHYEWDGVLTRYEGDSLDETTRTMPCRVRVDNPRAGIIVSDREGARAETAPTARPLTLVSGMFVTVKLLIDPPSPLLQIPEHAVQPGKTVWGVNNGQLKERKSLNLIELMRVQGDDEKKVPYWIVDAADSELAAGDHVVVPPFGLLRDGENVKEEAAP